MANRTVRRAFEKRVRNVKAGLYTLILVLSLIGLLVLTAAFLPPQISAWRSRRANDEAQERVTKREYYVAMDMLKHALALDPDNEEAHYNLGLLELTVNGNAVAAEERFRRATEINAGFARAYFNLGVVQLFYLQKTRIACDNLKNAARLEPAYSPAYATLGLAYESLGEYGQAREVYDTYLKLDPEGKWAALVREHRAAVGGLPAVDDLPAKMRDTDDVFELVAVGDVSLARGVNVDLYSGRSESPLRYVSPWVSRAAVAFANLESPLTKRSVPPADKSPAGGDIHLKGNPDYTFLLTEAGFDVVSVANNHIMDYGEQGLEDTLFYLDQDEIKHVGAGPDLNAALQPAEVDLDGYKIAFLAFSGVEPRGYFAESGKPGAAPLSEDVVVSAIAQAKTTANLVVLSLHWGNEGMAYPTSEQQRLAHKFADAGANVILGHHPHVIQGVESYEGAIIAYSLGNFLFDSRYADRRYSTLLTVEVSRSRGILGFRLLPIYIRGTEPVVADDGTMNEFMDFALLSASGKRLPLPTPDRAVTPAR